MSNNYFGREMFGSNDETRGEQFLVVLCLVLEEELILNGTILF